ncbi:MAG TPA: ABC transporter permease [Lentimicrobium sp.]|nr:ABC transporter permease [Lentimicrobium sp.]
MLVISYFTTSLRSLLRQKTYLIINLMGLAVGIAAYLMIMLYVTHEKGYDKQIEKRNNMVRVVEIQNEPGVGNQHVAITMGPLARELKNTFPQIRETVRIMPAYNINSVSYGSKLFRENNMLIADPEIIDMFSVKLIKGNPDKVLHDPHTMVISEDIAKKYFLTVENAINSTLMLNNNSYKVEGIMENQTHHTHIYFDMLISMSSIEGTPDFEWMNHWGSNSFVTYLLLDDPSSAETIEKELPRFIKEKIFSQNDGWEYLEMYLQPVNDIYLKSQHIKFQMVSTAGDSKTVLIFSVVAILILLIACINYINISLARSVKQAREVGMRKVLGADRKSLVYRFISESFAVTLIAILFAIGILELILPEINKVLGTTFKLDFGLPLFNIGLVLLLIVISLISGSYPAFYLSRYQPALVLKGGFTSSGRSGYLSKALIVFQFAISIGLIFSILMINDQIRYIQKKDLGIKYHNTLFVFFGQQDYKKLDILKQSLLENPAIVSVSGSSFMNGVSGSQGPIFIDDTSNTRLAVRYGFVDETFFSSMGIDIIEGRNFDPTIKSDSASAVILNEAAISKLGWDDINGKRLNSLDDDSLIKPKVIGVIRDYHYYSLKTLIEPAAYFYIPENFRGVTIKYAGHMKRQEAETFIEKKWKEIYPKTPYQSVSSDDYLLDGYKTDLKIRTLFVYFAIISMFLSAIGLYGLTSLLIEQKTKIIGIKKVLGSPVYSIIFNLIKEYILLVGLSGVIAIPISILFIKRFLDAYPYRVEISIPNVAAALLLAVLIAFMTIVFKAGKTANSNPLEALKYE